MLSSVSYKQTQCFIFPNILLSGTSLVDPRTAQEIHEIWVRILIQEVPLENLQGKWQSASAFLPGKAHRKGAWQDTVHGVTKSQTERLSPHARKPLA